MNKSNEKGSVLVYILVAVALLATLSFAVSKGQRGSVSTLTDQQTKLIANEIIDYGNAVAKAVQKLRLRGCTDTQISFENPIYTAYTNPNAPTDKSCHVFELAGGGLSYAKSPDPYFFPTVPTWRQSYGFMHGTEWQGVGNTCSSTECVDLIMLLMPLDKKICETINKILGFSTMPEDTFYSGSPFIGSYTSTTILGDEPAGTELIGKSAGCHKKIGTSTYSFMQVLIAR